MPPLSFFSLPFHSRNPTSSSHTAFTSTHLTKPYTPYSQWSRLVTPAFTERLRALYLLTVVVVVAGSCYSLRRRRPCGVSFLTWIPHFFFSFLGLPDDVNRGPSADGLFPFSAEPKLLGTTENGSSLPYQSPVEIHSNVAFFVHLALGLRSYFEDLGWEFVVSSSKEGPDSVAAKEIVDAE